MTYLDTNLLAQSYYFKAIKLEDGRFKDLYKNLTEQYNKKIEAGKDVNNIDYKIKTLKEQIQSIMKEKDLSAYTASDFIGKMAELDYLEKQKVVQDKKQKEEDCVQETFGELNLDDRRKPKTQQELIDERNEKLAILFNLKNSHKMHEEDYIKNVVAVRRVYERSIKTALVEDVKKVDINNKQHLRKFKNLLQRIKNVFKIGKPTADIENEVGKSTINKEYADNALKDVGSLLYEKNPTEARSCYSTSFEIESTIPEIKLSDTTDKIVDDFFLETIKQKEKTEYDSPNRSKEEKVDSFRHYQFNKRMNFTSIMNKSIDSIKFDRIDIENYILKTYKHTDKVTGNLKDGINVEHVFEDAEVNKAYKELQSMFKVQKESLERNKQALKELDDKTIQVHNTRQQNTEYNV